MRTKVLVTGMGVVSPVGNDIATFWQALREGRSGITAIDRFDADGFASQIAGQAEDCVPENMSAKDLRRRDRYAILGLVAAEQAWQNAGIDMAQEDPERFGAVIGTGIGGLSTIQEEMEVFVEKGPRRVSPLMMPKVLTNMLAGEIAIRFGLFGPNKSVVTACAASAHSIGEAANQIRAGRADVMVAGGSEAGVVPFGVAGFSAMKALSRRNDDPERASRPFDLDRDGFVMAEGSGMLVLESEEHAKARGAAILGEVAGFGESCDAHHVTAPRPDGSGAASAMRHALRDAGIELTDVGYFNAHGTSTKYNDAAECMALHVVFGEAMPPVSSTKSMTGHLLGAAGAIEAIACLLAIRDGVLPPSINYETPDPECVVNLVANEARKSDIAVAMSNSLGFGGHNASLIFKRYD